MTVQTSDGSRVPEWTWGDRLRKVRREAGLTQAGFAAAIEVKEKAYGAWEADANTPPFAKMREVATRIQLRFGVPRAWMLGVFDEVTPGPDGGGSAAPAAGTDSDNQRHRKLQFLPAAGVRAA